MININDSLPELKACYQLNLQFNIILLSAVWMHILPPERERAFRKITNLLPASNYENRAKSNRLPSQNRLMASRVLITDWWQQAWQSSAEQQRFFIEAGLSLPNISSGCRDFDEMFNALQFQMIGAKQRLQIAEW